MAIDNFFIADQFSLLSKLMDIHGENSFKSKSYSIIAFNIEKVPQPLADIPAAKLSSLKGIGDSTAKKIIEILQTGKLKILEHLIANTPSGVLDMLRIKGLGPKKIFTIWKEMEIESIGELLYACNENRLLLFKGFGAKTQQNVQEAIEFFMKSQGSYLYADIEEFALKLNQLIKNHIKEDRFELTGQFRRQLEVIDQLEWVTTAEPAKLKSFFENNGVATKEQSNGTIIFKGSENVLLKFYTTTADDLQKKLFETSCSAEFLEACQSHPEWHKLAGIHEEKDIFSCLQFTYLPPILREKITDTARKNVPDLIQPGDIKAIIHSHSNWSDGSNSIEEMAKACVDKGYEYLVISDHSRSAFYANGLTEQRIKEQHLYIDELNTKLKPFRIFKSIECDILNDGALDYSNNILSTFDLVIASVHSNIKMTEEKAMLRLLNAVQNPYTTILGHMTGRLLLSRPGYPVNYKKLIDVCAEQQVVIELNAHPRRLDIDWRWVDYALEKGCLISIDPDAHSTDSFADCRYGVFAAQKGGLTKENNLSSFSLQKFEEFLGKRKAFKKI